MKKITRKAVFRERYCETCMATFLSRSSRKRFCDICGADREREADRRRAAQKLRATGARPLGSSVPCANCGATFVLKSGPSKFCNVCSSERFNRWHREKRATDRKRNLSERMSRRINASLANGKEGRTWRSMVEFTLEELLRHLERQFLPGMTWQNRHRWHVDHIVPLASFEFETPDCPGFKAAWALTNLRPLWRQYNQQKSAKRTHLL